MSQDQSGEKQFAPTPKRLKDAARKGDVLRSRELATAAAMLVGTGWLAFAGPMLAADLLQTMRSAFQFDRAQLTGGVGLPDLGDVAGLLLSIMALGLIVSGASAVSQLAFGEGRWVVENLAFKGKRMNPLSGFKRMFGPTGLIEMGKGLLKVVLLGGIGVCWAWMWLEEVGALGRMTLSAQLEVSWRAILTLLVALTGGLMVIAVIDLPIQWLRRGNRLKMSHKEMRDENKESEGSPEMRAARRQRQRDIATGSIAGAMREAQFVVTNPSHFSVALAWNPDKASAPIVLAKGRGEKALAMREMAAELSLPLLEYPQLARALYFTTREQQMIREELYAAVAMIVAFVLSVKRGERARRPSIEIPVALRFDSEGRLQA